MPLSVPVGLDNPITQHHSGSVAISNTSESEAEQPSKVSGGAITVPDTEVTICTDMGGKSHV